MSSNYNPATDTLIGGTRKLWFIDPVKVFRFTSPLNHVVQTAELYPDQEWDSLKITAGNFAISGREDDNGTVYECSYTADVAGTSPILDRLFNAMKKKRWVCAVEDNQGFMRLMDFAAFTWEHATGKTAAEPAGYTLRLSTVSTHGAYYFGGLPNCAGEYITSGNDDTTEGTNRCQVIFRNLVKDEGVDIVIDVRDSLKCNGNLIGAGDTIYYMFTMAGMPTLSISGGYGATLTADHRAQMASIGLTDFNVLSTYDRLYDFNKNINHLVALGKPIYVSVQVGSPTCNRSFAANICLPVSFYDTRYSLATKLQLHGDWIYGFNNTPGAALWMCNKYTGERRSIAGSLTTNGYYPGNVWSPCLGNKAKFGVSSITGFVLDTHNIVNGHPGIIFFDPVNNEVYYITRNDTTFTDERQNWTVTYATGLSTARHTGAATGYIINGYPVVVGMRFESQYNSETLLFVLYHNGTVWTVAYLTDPALFDTVDGSGTDMRFAKAVDVYADGSEIYILQWDHDGRTPCIRKLYYTGNDQIDNLTDVENWHVLTIAGGANPISGNASLNLEGAVPTGAGNIIRLTADGLYQLVKVGGDFYLTAPGINKILKLEKTGSGFAEESTEWTLSVYAGAGTASSLNGDLLTATFNKPWGLCTDGEALYVNARNNGMLRKIADGMVTTLSGIDAIDIQRDTLPV